MKATVSKEGVVPVGLRQQGRKAEWCLFHCKFRHPGSSALGKEEKVLKPGEIMLLYFA